MGRVEWNRDGAFVVIEAMGRVLEQGGAFVVIEAMGRVEWNRDGAFVVVEAMGRVEWNRDGAFVVVEAMGRVEWNRDGAFVVVAATRARSQPRPGVVPRRARRRDARARADAAFRIAADCASESESSRGTRWRVVEVPDANEPDAAEATEEALAAIAGRRRLRRRRATRRGEGGGAAATERGWLRRAERAWNGARTARERTRTRDERSS